MQVENTSYCSCDRQRIPLVQPTVGSENLSSHSSLKIDWEKLLPTQELTLPRGQMGAKKIKASKGARTVSSLPGGI